MSSLAVVVTLQQPKPFLARFPFLEAADTSRWPLSLCADPRCTWAAAGGPTDGLLQALRHRDPRAGYRSAQDLTRLHPTAHGSHGAVDCGGSWWKCQRTWWLLRSLSSRPLGIPVFGARGVPGFGGLQGFLPEQSSLPSDEQTIDIPVPGRGVSGSALLSRSLTFLFPVEVLKTVSLILVRQLLRQSRVKSWSTFFFFFFELFSI